MNVNRETERGLVQVQIVNYLNWESTIACIESAKKQTYRSYRLIVIENASPNASLERLRDYDPNLSILVSDTNIGWGAGLNLGFFHHGFDTNPEFYLTANSDVTLEPDCLSKLVETMEANPNCAVVSPIVYENRHSTRANNVGFNFSYKYLIPLDFSRLIGSHRKWATQGTRQVSWVSDTVALMRRGAICTIGGYDERYFMYGQMTDMGYRLKQQGYDLVVDCGAVAYHTGKGSSGGELSGFSVYYKVRNWIFFQKKHFGGAHLLYVLFWSIGVILLYSVRALSQGRAELIMDLGRGLVDGFASDLADQTGDDDV